MVQPALHISSAHLRHIGMAAAIMLETLEIVVLNKGNYTLLRILQTFICVTVCFYIKTLSLNVNNVR